MGSIRNRCFILAIHDETQNNYIIKHLQDTYPKGSAVKWAYSHHDSPQDLTEDGEPVKPHVHYFIKFNNPRYLSGVAEELKIPDYMVQICRDQKSSVRYLIHYMNENPNKYHYDKTNICSNFDIDPYFADDLDTTSVMDYWHDYCKLRKGEITAEQFLECRTIYLVKLNALQLIQMFEKIYNCSTH